LNYPSEEAWDEQAAGEGDRSGDATSAPEQDRVARYRQRLIDDSGSMEAREGDEAAAGGGKARGAMGAEPGLRVIEGIVEDGKTATATGLASLDIELPQRGKLYMFTTPRGDIRLSARSLPRPLIARGRMLGWVLGAIVVLAIGWRLARKVVDEVLATSQRARGFGMVLAGLGLVSVVTGIFPVLGIAAVVAGIVLARKNMAPAPATAA
jgi:hypothetical protein